MLPIDSAQNSDITNIFPVWFERFWFFLKKYKTSQCAGLRPLKEPVQAVGLRMSISKSYFWGVSILQNMLYDGFYHSQYIMRERKRLCSLSRTEFWCPKAFEPSVKEGDLMWSKFWSKFWSSNFTPLTSGGWYSELSDRILKRPSQTHVLSTSNALFQSTNKNLEKPRFFVTT